MPLIDMKKKKSHELTQCKKSAILGREELFLQLKIEEMLFWEDFLTLFQRLFLKWQTPIHVRQKNNTTIS